MMTLFLHTVYIRKFNVLLWVNNHTIWLEQLGWELLSQSDLLWIYFRQAIIQLSHQRQKGGLIYLGIVKTQTSHWIHAVYLEPSSFPVALAIVCKQQRLWSDCRCTGWSNPLLSVPFSVSQLSFLAFQYLWNMLGTEKRNTILRLFRVYLIIIFPIGTHCLNQTML